MTLTGVTITAPTVNAPGTYTFTATIAPVGEPGVTLTWSPDPDAGQGTTSADYSFTCPVDIQSISITATKDTDSFTDSAVVGICGTLRAMVSRRLRACSGVTDIVGASIYPDRVPEKATYPLIVYHVPIADTDAIFRTHDRATGRSVSTVQLDCYGQSFPTTSGAYGGDGADELAEAVIDCFNGYDDACCCIGRAHIENRIAERQDSLNEYRQIIDISIDYLRN
jgi:hypothetical protein